MSFTKDQYIYLLNILQLKGIKNYRSNWNQNDNVKDMRTALKETLNQLNYTETRNNYSILKQYIETLPGRNIIEEEPSNIESNPFVNQNFIHNENMGEIPQVTFKRTSDNLKQKRQVNISPDMEAMIDLIADQKKEIKRLESLMT
jgi:hypothetical protein